MRRSDAIVVYNEVEREVVQTELSDGSAVVMPWIVPARETIPTWSETFGRRIPRKLSAYAQPRRRRILRPSGSAADTPFGSNCEFYVYGPIWKSCGNPSMTSRARRQRGRFGAEVAEAFDRHRVFVAPLRYEPASRAKWSWRFATASPPY